MRLEGMTFPVNSRTAVTDQPAKPAVRESGSADAESKEQAAGYRGDSKSGAQGGGIAAGRGQPEELKLRQTALERQREDLAERLAFLKQKPEDEQGEKVLKEISEAIREMNKDLELKHLTLRFQLHDDSQRWMVRIIDIMDDEVIREIPPEKMLELSARIQSTIGVMLDTQR